MQQSESTCINLTVTSIPLVSKKLKTTPVCNTRYKLFNYLCTSKCQLRWYRSAESTGRQSQLPALHSEMARKNDGQRRTVDRLESAPDVRFHCRHYLIKASLHCHTAQHSRISLCTLCTLTPSINSLKPARSTVARGIWKEGNYQAVHLPLWHLIQCYSRVPALMVS